MFRITLISCLVLFLGCTKSASERGKKIVLNSIETHSGTETFQDLKSVSFVKTTRLFKEDGTLESETLQKQSFELNPEYKGTITWEECSVNHEIIYDRKKALKKVNYTVVVDSIELEKALKTALSADYVFFQPFKLLDRETELRYEGIQMIRDTIKTSVVGISYTDDTANSDSWKYYFDKKYHLVAVSVKHNNRISLIENLKFQNYKGILFNKHRKSYFVDSLLQKKYLRAEYFYDIIETRQ